MFRLEFAQHCREIARRASWFGHHNQLPITPPPDWDSYRALEGSGERGPVGHFAIARHLDAHRGDPPHTGRQLLDEHAEKCRIAASILDKFESDEVRLPLEELARKSIRKLRAAQLTIDTGGLLARPRRLALDAQQAVFEARQQLGRPRPGPALYDAAIDPFPCLLWMPKRDREQGLVAQAYALFGSGLTYVQVGHIMGWERGSNRATLESVKGRFKRL